MLHSKLGWRKVKTRWFGARKWFWLNISAQFAVAHERHSNGVHLQNKCNKWDLTYHEYFPGSHTEHHHWRCSQLIPTLAEPIKTNVIIETIRKVRENTGPEPPEFGLKPGEIHKKKPTKKYISLLQGWRAGWNSEMHHFCGKLSFFVRFWFPLSFFPERLHCCYIYFHCSYLYNFYNCLDPCALNA